MTRRLSSLLVIAPLALSLTACADEDEPPPEDATQAEVVAMTAPVESALASPTGVVAADSMSDIFAAMSSQETAQGPLGFIPGAGPGAAPQQTGTSECMDVGATGGSIDMGCISGGEMTGKVVYSFAGDAQTAYMLMDYQNVCVDSFCMDGEAAQKIVTSASGDLDMTLAFDFTVTDAASTHARAASRSPSSLAKSPKRSSSVRASSARASCYCSSARPNSQPRQQRWSVSVQRRKLRTTRGCGSVQRRRARGCVQRRKPHTVIGASARRNTRRASPNSRSRG